MRSPLCVHREGQAGGPDLTQWGASHLSFVSCLKDDAVGFLQNELGFQNNQLSWQFNPFNMVGPVTRK